MTIEENRPTANPAQRREFGEDFWAILGSMPDFKRPPQTESGRLHTTNIDLHALEQVEDQESG